MLNTKNLRHKLAAATVAAASCCLGASAAQPVVPADKKMPSAGLSGKNIALWNSHGRYYNLDKNQWQWQRCHLHQTIEDLYTAEYVLDLLAPMLENAGAYVMMPRERDTNEIEIIIDKDSNLSPGYSERNGSKAWEESAKAGFRMPGGHLGDRENPFTQGNTRQVQSIAQGGAPSIASYNAEIPEAGTYTIYVSYPTLPNSSDAVRYAVNSARGREQFTVNQAMGGGTWIRLGEFPLNAGLSELPIVEISNVGDAKNRGKIVGADAVKIGGGIGNVARGDGASKPKVSGLPRWAEGARYWMQWAGIPDSIYSPKEYDDDYSDDYISRPMWVNYLSGGSSKNRRTSGLGIPIDLSFALHTDAGNEPDSTYVGTLGIYYTKGGRLANGQSRATNRELARSVVSNIVNDIRAKHDTAWVQRKMRDKAYKEASIPQVPAMLLELLSHQNFSDMLVGQNPEFRFDVARAIYKGMLKYLARSEGRSYTVQPLPVSHFAITESGGGTFTLTWQPTQDNLEPSAKPSDYIIEIREGTNPKGAFKPLAEAGATRYEFNAERGRLYSFRIVARNKGGRSFPSETLSLGYVGEDAPTVLVVNGFTRISAPAWFDDGSNAGFLDMEDYGVPYMRSVGYTGSQYDFDRTHEWVDDIIDPGYGASNTDFDAFPIAGNTFDYAAVHGEAIMQAGYTFISSSLEGYLDNPKAYRDDIIDLILGRQGETQVYRDVCRNKFKAFPAKLQAALRDHTESGGSLIVSGENVASDLLDNRFSNSLVAEADARFAADVLGIESAAELKNPTGRATFTDTETTAEFYVEPNPEIYPVAHPDALRPADAENAAAIAKYDDGSWAGIRTTKGDRRVTVLGLPLEAVTSPEARAAIMRSILL